MSVLLRQCVRIGKKKTSEILKRTKKKNDFSLPFFNHLSAAPSTGGLISTASQVSFIYCESLENVNVKLLSKQQTLHLSVVVLIINQSIVQPPVVVMTDSRI